MLHLRMLEESQFVQEFKFDHPPVNIGRSGDVDITMSATNRLVSRQHGAFVVQDGRTIYRDVSKLGTTVRCSDGHEVSLHKLRSEWEVKPGDQLVIGTCTLEIVDIFSNPQSSEWGDSEWDGNRTRYVIVEQSPACPPADHRLLAEFLELPAYDPLSVEEAKEILARSLLQAFPQASSVAIADLLAQPESLSRDDIDYDSLLVMDREGRIPGRHFSRSLAAAAHEKRAVATYSLCDVPSPSESVRNMRAHFCMCAPLIAGKDVTGFAQLFASGVDARCFGEQDLHIFALTASIASLLLRQARAAHHQATIRTMASVGQVVAGMCHETKNVLASVGQHALSVEKSFSALADCASWQFVREDLDMIHDLTMDTLGRIATSSRPLRPAHHHVRPLVESVLARCRRYYLSGYQPRYIELRNACPAESVAFVDERALTVALMNCIKNSIDAYAQSPTANLASVVVSALDEGQAPDAMCVVNIVDDAGGIPPAIVRRLGQLLVTTKGEKGTGLGICNLVDAVARLNGRVVVATSHTPVGDFPAGTVFSIHVPRSAACSNGRADTMQVDLDYEGIRRRCLASRDSEAEAPSIT